MLKTQKNMLAHHKRIEKLIRAGKVDTYFCAVSSVPGDGFALVKQERCIATVTDNNLDETREAKPGDYVTGDTIETLHEIHYSEALNPRLFRAFAFRRSSDPKGWRYDPEAVDEETRSNRIVLNGTGDSGMAH